MEIITTCQPYNPDNGNFIEQILGGMSISGTANPYTYDYDNNIFIIKRNNSFVLSDTTKPGYNYYIHFYGPNNRYLLIFGNMFERAASNYFVDARLYDLEDINSLQRPSLIDRSYYCHLSSSFHISLSPGNKLALFIKIIDPIGDGRNETIEAKIFRSDNGQEIPYHTNMGDPNSLFGYVTSGIITPEIRTDSNTNAKKVVIKNGTDVIAQSDPILGRCEIIPSPDIDFGRIDGGREETKSFTLKNAGLDCLEVTNISTNDDRLRPDTTQFPLKAGEEKVVNIIFSNINPPASDTEVTARIDVKWKWRTETTSTIDVTCTALAEVHGIYVHPPYLLNFGNVFIGCSGKLQVIIDNLSRTSRANITVSSQFPPEFRITTQIPNEVPAGGRVTMRLEFSPTNQRNYSGMITISDGYNSTIITLNGFGLKPVSINPTLLDFSTICIGKSSDLSIDISNHACSSPVTISNNISGSTNAFLILSSITTVNLNMSARLKIRFKPLQEGFHSATLNIQSSGPIAQSFSIRLSGRGIATNNISLSETMIDFGEIYWIISLNIPERSFKIGNDGCPAIIGVVIIDENPPNEHVFIIKREGHLHRPTGRFVPVPGRPGVYQPEQIDVPYPPHFPLFLLLDSSEGAPVTIKFLPMRNGEYTAKVRVTSCVGNNCSVLTVDLKGKKVRPILFPSPFP